MLFRHRFHKFILPCFACAVPLLHAQLAAPSSHGCPVFPANSIWNTRIDQLPVSPNSGAYVSELGANLPLHPDFGAAPWAGYPNGYPVNVVHGKSVQAADVAIQWPWTSDSGPYPIPSNAVVGGPPDRHMIIFDTDHCTLYESYSTTHSGGTWNVVDISKFNLLSNAPKPNYWASANAAGTPQFPLLVRYDEVAAGHINHAISVTASKTANWAVWPAVHWAPTGNPAPPMGQRFRLKANVDISHFSKTNQVILEALKTYGMIITDNGASWHIQGEPDPHWNDTDLHALTQIPASDFEAVDESSLMISQNSDAAAAPIPSGWVTIVNRHSGKCLDLPGSDIRPGVSIEQWSCNGGANQRFQFLPVSGAWIGNSSSWKQAHGNGYVIVNAASGQGLNIPGSSTQSGKQIIQWPYSITVNEVWSPVSVGGGYYYLQSLLDGQVLDDKGQSLNNGSVVLQWPYWGGSNQQWKLVPVNK